jgi:hypothetical protein
MDMPRPISDGEYGDMLATFKRSAFRLEMRDFYAIGEERTDYVAFLAGVPRMPDQVGWWKQYLDGVANQTRQGKTRSRVRVLADPPTDYQQWMLWADPWYAEAGEDIRYLPVRKAYESGLPDADWWLLDGERAVILAFDDDGHIEQRTLVTDPVLITHYRLWRALAIRDSVPAAQIAAA